jgi:signal peptidase I
MRCWLPAAAAATLLAAVAALAARRMFTLVTVTGYSMTPDLAEGDRVLVLRARLAQLRPGHVVVLESPGTRGYEATVPGGREWIIKRVAAVPGELAPPGSLPAAEGRPGALVPPGKFVVLGDNAAWSHDSRQIGYIPGDRLLGVVVRKILAVGDQPPPRRPRTTPASGTPSSV